MILLNFVENLSRTSSGISSAKLLIGAAEAVLPKQRKVLALSEFKQAAIAHKRGSKTPQCTEGNYTKLLIYHHLRIDHMLHTRFLTKI